MADLGDQNGLERGKAPLEWRKAIIVPLHKKGSKLECQNYKGISLLSILGKVYARVLNESEEANQCQDNGVAGRVQRRKKLH